MRRRLIIRRDSVIFMHRVREYRKDQRMSQRKLAEQITEYGFRITPGAYAKCERTIEYLPRFADREDFRKAVVRALGVPMSELLSGDLPYKCLYCHHSSVYCEACKTEHATKKPQPLFYRDQ